MNRRQIISAAPAASLIGFIPAVAAADETPVMALFRQWQTVHDFANCEDTPNDVHNAACRELTKLEGLIAGTPSRNSTDVLMKFCSLTEFGGFTLSSQVSDDIWDEARTFIGGSA